MATSPEAEPCSRSDLPVGSVERDDDQVRLFDDLRELAGALLAEACADDDCGLGEWHQSLSGNPGKPGFRHAFL